MDRRGCCRGLTSFEARAAEPTWSVARGQLAPPSMCLPTSNAGRQRLGTGRMSAHTARWTGLMSMSPGHQEPFPRNPALTTVPDWHRLASFVRCDDGIPGFVQVSASSWTCVSTSNEPLLSPVAEATDKMCKKCVDFSSRPIFGQTSFPCGRKAILAIFIVHRGCGHHLY